MRSIQWLALLGLAATSGLAARPQSAGAQSSGAQAPAVSGARAKLAALAADYGIEIVVVDAPTKFVRGDYDVTAKPVSDAMLERYEPIFEKEWRRYPRSLMILTRLGRILIGADVRVDDQPRAAVPEFVPGWFWLDADVGSRLPTYGRHVIHHDFFHVIDEFHTPNGRKDPDWEKLNPPGFHYGKGGWFMQRPGVGELRADLPGFLCEYATSAVEEDKAEVYSFLLTATPFVMDRVKEDPVIAAKVARIKALIVAFSPTMDEDWFARNASH